MENVLKFAYLISIYLIYLCGCSSTESYRKDKDYEFVYGGAGGDLDHRFGEVDIFHSESWQSFVSYSDGARLQALEIGQRLYWGNSWYFRIGINGGFVTNVYSASEEHTTTNYGPTYYVREQFSAFSFGLGNRWLFDNLVFGLEWGGGFHPFYRKFDSRESSHSLTEFVIKRENPDSSYGWALGVHIGLSL